MNIKRYLTSDVKRLLTLLIIASIIFTITAILIANGKISLFGLCLLVTSFIAIPVLIGTLISYICDLHIYYRDEDSANDDN